MVEEGGAHPTHPGAESIITTLASEIDVYAQRYGEIADNVWAEEYVNNTYKQHLSIIGDILETKKERKLKNKSVRKQPVAV